MSSILQLAVAAKKTIVSWGETGPGLVIDKNGPLNGLVAYDWYYLGEQMAKAVHEAYPNGANLGYIHWINDTDAILLREQGFLDGLKQYPNIKVITAGGTANPKSANSGFSDPNGSEAYTEAFLQAHPSVNVIFAPWENPPGLGEEAAIKALHLQGKVSIVTMDLAEAGAASLKDNGIIKVDMGEDVYDGGRMMALTSALSAPRDVLPVRELPDLRRYPRERQDGLGLHARPAVPLRRVDLRLVQNPVGREVPGTQPGPGTSGGHLQRSQDG